MWRLFRRTAQPDVWSDWWQDANRAAERPTAAALDALRGALQAAGPDDDVEAQEEMLDGLRQLVGLAALEDLPVLETQHRVVGSDVCHFTTPVTLPEPAGGSGKLFLTSRRLVLVAGGVTSRPWHALRRVSRIGRQLTVESGGSRLEVQCNTFGEALVACYLATWLSAGRDRS